MCLFCTCLYDLKNALYSDFIICYDLLQLGLQLKPFQREEARFGSVGCGCGNVDCTALVIGFRAASLAAVLHICGTEPEGWPQGRKGVGLIYLLLCQSTVTQSNKVKHFSIYVCLGGKDGEMFCPRQNGNTEITKSDIIAHVLELASLPR